MGTTRWSGLTGAVLAVASTHVKAAVDDDIVFTAQSRTISGEVSATSAGGTDTDAGSAEAADFGTFNEELHLSATAPVTRATVDGDVWQYSTLGPTFIQLNSGGMFLFNGCQGPCTGLDADLLTTFEVTFVAKRSFRFTMIAHIGLPEPPPCDSGGAATLSFAGPTGLLLNKSTIFLQNIFYGEALPPGVYTIATYAGPAPTRFCPDYGLTGSWFTAYIETCAGDVNGDGEVDPADIAAVLGAWGSSEPLADIDGDGVVGAPDLALLLGGWGPCLSGNTCLDSGHDCFTTGAPGCFDIACCDAVCAVDPFCCSVSWDALCVDEAGWTCGVP